MYAFFSLLTGPLYPPRWLSGYGVVLLRPIKYAGSISATVAAFLLEVKKRKRPRVEISEHVKHPQVVWINPKPSTTAHLVALV